MREPVVAGTFYPFATSELRGIIEKFHSYTKQKQQQTIAVVAPHAGYIYCGKTAAAVYASIGNNFDTVIILGPNHTGMGAGIAISQQAWKTPLGSVLPDMEFSSELLKNSLFAVDERAHMREHSIEVQLPWLQFRFHTFKFIPVCINPIYFDVEHCKKTGTAIADAAKKLNRKILIVASSDFTHHGAAYGYNPFRGNPAQVLKKIKEQDMEIANYAAKIMPEKLVETCYEKHLTICGYGAIAASLWAAQKLGARNGAVLDYTTSFDVSRDISAVVGYCGIAIF